MHIPSAIRRAILLLAVASFLPITASAAEVMCDPSFQDCRAMLLSRIQSETVAIDVAMLFMEDDALADAIIARFNAGVSVRMIVEPRRNLTTPKNVEILDRLSAAGIPMRAKNGGGMLHWKFMIFDAQNVMEWSAANYSDFYFKPIVPYANYTDEGIYFTDQPSLIDSFRRKFDDAWVDPTAITNFANITSTPTRRYPLYSIDPDLSFVPWENFATRSVPFYDAEQVRIDSIMYKVTEPQHADGLIRAVQRGIPVRLITEGERYRNGSNFWQAYHIDRLYMAGVQIRNRAHEGFLHQKSTLLYGQGMTIFGSSNWTNESNGSQYEHNYFTHKTWFFDWFRQNFERKWNNQTGAIETVPFTPLPPDPPAYSAPANGATGIATTGVSLQWNPGPWGWTADIYFGTSPSPPLYRAGISAWPSDIHSFALPTLNPSTTYYWKIVSKTMALQQAAGAVYSFTTAGTAPPPPPPNAAPVVSITSPANNSTFTAPATIAIAANATDSDGTIARVDFYSGSTLLGYDATSPYQFSWSGVPAGSYTISALAYDNAGATATSTSVTVTVTAPPPPPPPPSNAAPTVSITSPANNSTFTAPATIAITANAADSDGTISRVDFYSGTTLLGYDATSPYQFSWSGVPAGSYSISALAYDNAGATATSTSVTVTVAAPPPTATLPAPWQSQDIGAVGVAGRASASNGTFTIAGSGADVWGSADGFHFAWQQMNGDVDVIARVASVEYVAAWAKAGVMIRERLTADSAHAFMLVSAGKGLAFQRRVANGGLSTNTSGSLGAAPAWVKLERRANTITASLSSDGTNWTLVGSDTFAMPATVYVGLGVSSHDNTRLATATFDNLTLRSVAPPPPPPANVAPSVAITSPASNATFTAPATISIAASASDSDGTVARVDFYAGATLIGSDTAAPYAFSWSNVPSGSYTLTARATDNAGAATTSAGVTVTVADAPPPPPSTTLPSPWTSQDIGAVGPAGSATASNGLFTIKGAGADVWGSADAFHYVWQPVSGDVDVVARVASVEYVAAWVKAGVMIRERLTADSPHAFMLVSAGKGIALQRRIAAGGLSTSTAGAFGAAPAWVKLERRANTITAYQSADGANWSIVGSDTFSMPTTVYVGLAVSSHDATRVATATFDNVRVQAPIAAPPPPIDHKEIVLYSSDVTVLTGPWRFVADSTAAGGTRVWNPDAGTAKVVTALADPPGYVELSFTADAGRAYRLWIRGNAERDDWANDSAHVQFSGSVDAQGTPVYRIGTTSSAEYNLESCKGCGLAGWGWEDNGWGAGVLGPVIYFATSGTQRIRIQNREDGLSFDQIVLSAERYITAAPGPAKFDATIVPK